MKKKARRYIHIITLLAVMCLDFPLYSLEVKSVQVTGSSVDIDLSPVTGIKNADLSEENIRLLEARVINIYHSLGYISASIEKSVLKKNGILEIHLNEGIIEGIVINGVKGDTKDEIYALLEPEIGTAFNDIKIKSRIKSIRSLISLQRISIKPQRQNNGKIQLIVNASKKTGTFHGKIGMDMIYGVSPLIGYWYPGENYAVNAWGIAGIKEGEIRRLEGGVRFFSLGESGGVGLLLGASGGRRIERWESLDLEYYRKRVAPEAGFTFNIASMFGKGYLEFNYEELEEYPGSEKLMSPSFNIELVYNSYGKVLNKREASFTSIGAAAGHENINERFYFRGLLNGIYPLFPFSSLRLVPRFAVSYISSDERLLWSYVFDNSMMGIFNDYTASKWKNVAGLDIEYELSRSFLYIGPFINSAYFINEENQWKLKTGTGVMTIVKMGALMLKLVYGWNIDEGAGKGGIFFIIEGGF